MGQGSRPSSATCELHKSCLSPSVLRETGRRGSVSQVAMSIGHCDGWRLGTVACNGQHCCGKRLISFWEGSCPGPVRLHIPDPNLDSRPKVARHPGTCP